ncbi:hypothetical protein ACMFMG_009705 [Clarireedia jacksonii]
MPRIRDNLGNAPAPTAAALLPNPNVDAAVPIPQTSLSLTAVPANDTAIATTTTSTSTGSPATGTSTAIGGIRLPAITMTEDSDRPFQVNGNTFTSQDALDRACTIQHNKCADAVNDGELSDIDVSACDAQQASCIGGAKR